MASQQIWNPKQYADHARFVTDLGAPLIELLAPKARERILDLGCGDGVLTKHLMDLGCDVLGVDASPAMVEAAQVRGVSAQVMDGTIFPFTNGSTRCSAMRRCTGCSSRTKSCAISGGHCSRVGASWPNSAGEAI